MPLPDQHLVYGLAFLLRHVESNLRVGFMVDHLAGAIVTIRGDQDAAAGIGNSPSTGLSAEPAEYN